MKFLNLPMINNLKWFFKNLWTYRKFLWEDRWFDYAYFYKMLRHRLEYMAEKFEKEGLAVISKDLSYKMKECVTILDRLIEDNYFPNEDITDFKGKFEEYKKLLEKENKDINNDVNQLFEILKENIREWWD